MVSSSKSPEETKILTSSDTSLSIVRKESPPEVIWVSVDRIAHIMSINDSSSLPADEEVHFQNLPLVLLPDTPSEGEVREHASFRVALDGFANWSSVSQNPFLPISTNSFPMAHVFVPVPLSVDNIDEIPLDELILKKSRRRLKTFNKDSVSIPMSEPSSPIDIPSLPTVRVPQTRQKRCQVEAELISALTALNRTSSSTFHPLQTPTVVLSDDDIVSRKDRCGKHITSKPSRSKPSTKTKKSSLPKASPKPASKIRCSKQSMSKSKKKTSCFPCFFF
ncbi:hypothetical protein MTR67_031521 [Solanum verrucosum]|uniref:Uncharacterized protein n=1 Tax=Solanum verrucosum TaxID=315347 RepID=A0AAF0U2P7_SOLVR|nr:hypothetical protein MTR67_031521 [Solanum verrucosum]